MQERLRRVQWHQPCVHVMGLFGARCSAHPHNTRPGRQFKAWQTVAASACRGKSSCSKTNAEASVHLLQLLDPFLGNLAANLHDALQQLEGRNVQT